MDRSQALPLVRLIYEAALDPPRWQEFVQALSDRYGGAPVGFALQLPGFPVSGAVYASRGFTDDYLERFMPYATRGLPWERGRRRDFVGRFGLTSEVIDDGSLHDSDFYREWMAPQGLGPHAPIGHTVALEQGRPLAGLAIFATEATGPFGPAHLGFGDELAPHLALGYRLMSQTRRYEALADAIDRFPTGVVLLDGRARVVTASRAAREIFDARDGLSLVDESPCATDPESDAALRRAIDRSTGAAPGSQEGESAVLSIARRSGKHTYPAMLSPLRPHAGAPTLGDAAVVLYVSDLDSGRFRRREALRELYGLTEAEAHLVVLLCQGHSLDQAAAERGVTTNTARSQLKQAFAKTRTGRQSELVRLVLSGVASMGEE